jgi:hypothetical protein
MLDCAVLGGVYFKFKDIQPDDMVTCFLFAQGTRRATRELHAGLQILGSVYDYYYKTAIEQPGYGLYSYVLLTVYSQRAEYFLNEVFKTTSFVELHEFIFFKNLNIIYLPTMADKILSLMPMIADGSSPPVHLFAKQFYDFGFAQKMLAQICISPSKEIQEVCGTDLSRGPYLFTFTRPASGLSPVSPPFLFVDLSNVHERAFGEFIALIKNR